MLRSERFDLRNPQIASGAAAKPFAAMVDVSGAWDALPRRIKRLQGQTDAS